MGTRLQGICAVTAGLLLIGLAARAAPNPNSAADIDVEWQAPDQVAVTSTKDLSNVTIMYCDGSVEKLDDLEDGHHELTLSGNGPIYAVAAKSGTTTVTEWNPLGCDSADETPR